MSVPSHPAPVFVWLVTDARGDVLGLLASGGAPLSLRAYGPYGKTASCASRASESLDATTAAQADAAVRLGFAG
ncbi:MAG: hypothetical protein LLG24_09685 [Actinomycetia bacterium]|nr:hypothetical protein [Actinomycetes bacterium]